MLAAMLRRRDFVKVAAAGWLLPACGGDDFVEVCDEPVGDELDTVLTKLHATDPEFDGGLSNHGPMAAEVLVHVGRNDRLCDWVGSYAGVLVPLRAAQPLAPSERASALGDVGKRAEWIATFEQEVAGDLAILLAAQWPILLSGYVGASLHGALRTGHALRALSITDSPQRRRELAHGLGYWSSRHTTLPGTPGSAPVAGFDAVQALAALSLVPDQKTGGFVHERITTVQRHAPFASEVASVDLEVWSIEQTLSELAAACARLYVADSNRSDLGYLHAFDGTSILRTMLPFMNAPTQRAALAAAFHAVAAVHVTHGSKPGVPNDVYGSHDPAALQRRAAGADDEHTIKFVEALLREHAIDPRPELLEAAARRLG
jgi:hypothetical protein